MKQAKSKHRPPSHDLPATDSTARASAKAQATGNDEFGLASRSPLEGPWLTFRQRHRSRLAKFQISMIMSYFERHGISPAIVTEQTLADFEHDFKASGRAHGASLTNCFRRAIAAVADGGDDQGLPQVDAPRRRAPRQIQWEALPDSLRHDIENYEKSLRQRQSIAMQITQRNRILREIEIVTAAGLPPEKLIDLFSRQSIAILLRHPSFGSVKSQNLSRSKYFEFGRAYARHLYPDRKISDEIDIMLKKLPRRTSRLSSQTMQLLLQFSTSGTVARLSEFCGQKVTEFIQNPVNYNLKAKAQACLGILIILETALPRANVVETKFSGAAHVPGERLRLQAPDTRPNAGQRQIENDLSASTIRQIDAFHEACLGVTGKAPVWLLELGDGTQKSASTFSVAISKVGKEVGLTLTALLLRDLTVVYLRDAGASRAEAKDALGIAQMVNFNSRYKQIWVQPAAGNTKLADGNKDMP